MIGVLEGAGDDILLDDAGGSGVYDLDSKIVGKHGADSIDEPYSGHGGKENQPEPKEDIDLFVDDIERKNT